MLLNVNSQHFARHLNSSKASHFSSILSGQLVSDCFGQIDFSFRDRIFNPLTTLFLFLTQVLSDDKSCLHAVTQLLALRSLKNQQACSLNSGSYCKAKARLPLEFIRLLSCKVANLAPRCQKENWPWPHGDVKVVDGTGISMPDTQANCTAFPKHRSKRLCAFPGARLLGLFSLATGGLIDLAVAPLKGKGTGELSLFSKFWHHFTPGDTILGDSIFSTYWIIAKASSLGIQIVAEMRPKSTWRLKKRHLDQIITIEKSKFPPVGMDAAEWKALPQKVTVRVVKLTCAPAGFRPKVKYILTTHLYSKTVTIADICDLYRKRWQVETNLHSLKITLGMDVLRGKSPEMVQKEIWMYALAYNLVRLKMIEAADHLKKTPLSFSFKATQRIILLQRELQFFGIDFSDDVIEAMINAMGEQRVGKRPDRYEPRAIKRRGKNYGTMPPDRKQAKRWLFKKYKKKPAA